MVELISVRIPGVGWRTVDASQLSEMLGTPEDEDMSGVSPEKFEEGEEDVTETTTNDNSAPLSVYEAREVLRAHGVNVGARGRLSRYHREMVKKLTGREVA